MEINVNGIANNKESKKQIDDLLIIGSGPAGLSAALYGARAELKSLVITGMELHGQAALTSEIENYPGFPKGIGGAELGVLFQEQAEKFGARIVMDTIVSVDFSKRPFLAVGYNGRYHARAIIIATGASPKHINVPGEKEFTGRGVSYCATCDGWFFKGKNVVVIGGGDSALEEALFLTRFAASVTILHRRDELRAGKLLQNRAQENPKIHYIWSTILEEIIGDTAVREIIVRNLKSGKTEKIASDGVFVFIGHSPNTELFENQIIMDKSKYLIVDNNMRTNIQGVFAAGEVADPVFRQVVTSAGMGAAAAIQATKYLEELN